MLIFLAFIVYLMGVMVVLSDCYWISVGMGDTTVLAGLLRAGQMFGHPEWEAFAIWLFPSVMGLAIMMMAAWAPRPPRPPPQSTRR